MTCSKSGAQAPNILSMKQPICGYAANDNQRLALIEFGIPEQFVWTAGQGGEDLKSCLEFFRGVTGTLVMACEGRTLGDGKNIILEAAKLIETAGVAVIDALDETRNSILSITEHALGAAAGWARIRGRRVARRMGKDGGLAKGIAAAAKRASIMADEAVRRMVAHPKLTLRDCADILGPPFSMATLYRNYRNEA